MGAKAPGGAANRAGEPGAIEGAGAPEPRGPAVVLLGSPGVGKGTQGTRLGRTKGWAHLSTGDLLRRAVQDGTALGREASRCMAAGALVPDDVIVGLVRERLGELGRERGVVFDGFPRTAAQAEALDDVLADQGRSVDLALLLEADDAVVVGRISGRRSSPSGRIYHVDFDPPRREGVCDDTGEPLVHRADDRPETVRKRLEVYRRETAPLIDLYGARGALARVDAGGDIEAVWNELLLAVSDR